MSRRLAALVCLLVTAGCGGETPTSPLPIDGERLTMRMQTSHFQILGGGSPDATLRGAADSLEREYARILGDLGVSTHPVVTVRIYQDPTSYYAAFLRLIDTNADLQGVVGLTSAEFEAWQAYVRQRYLS